jgi:hypothetical protein
VNENELLDKFKEMFGCDTARITKPIDRMFLIIGDKCRSEGQWFRNGEPHSFDYIAEKCIASGYTEDELIASAEKYRRLQGMTMVEAVEQGLVP